MDSTGTALLITGIGLVAVTCCAIAIRTVVKKSLKVTEEIRTGAAANGLWMYKRTTLEGPLARIIPYDKVELVPIRDETTITDRAREKLDQMADQLIEQGEKIKSAGQKLKDTYSNLKEEFLSRPSSPDDREGEEKYPEAIELDRTIPITPIQTHYHQWKISREREALRLNLELNQSIPKVQDPYEGIIESDNSDDSQNAYKPI